MSRLLSTTENEVLWISPSPFPPCSEECLGSKGAQQYLRVPMEGYTLIPSLKSTHHSDPLSEPVVAQSCSGGEMRHCLVTFNAPHFKVNNVTKCSFKKLSIMTLRKKYTL